MKIFRLLAPLETIADRVQNTGVIGRLYIYILGIYFSALSFVPTTQIGKALDVSGVVGDALGAALFLSCLAGVTDAVINDVMTDRWVLRAGLQYRHYLLMSVACLYGVAMFMVHGTLTGYWYVYLFLINSIFACLAALFDIRRRFKK